MDLDSYRKFVHAIPGGKRLPNALYLHVDGIGVIGPDLLALLMMVQRSIGVDPALFNLLKFHLDEMKISFLNYPTFETEAHPALVQSTVVDLAAGTRKEHLYSNSENPPILHRKETFLPDGHPKAALFAELTEEEERLGLYENQTRIGFFRQWHETLKEKGIRIDGHRLTVENVAEEESTDLDESISVDRHKTAISRFALSRPVQALLRHELLTPAITFFDYGCGLGDDLRALNDMGYKASGWDPVYRPESAKHPADIVNLGFVINVIENPDERVEVLRDAFRLCRVALSVSAMVKNSYTATLGTPYRDGVLSSRKTFQKYYSQEELGRFIEDVLGTEPVAVAPGSYLIFQEATERQRFIARRSRRSIDWATLSAKVFANKPKLEASRPYPKRVKADVYLEHQDLIDAFWKGMVQLGRLPKIDEFDRSSELEAAKLTPIQLKNLYVQRFGAGALDKAYLDTHRDLLKSFWDVLCRFGRLPDLSEYGRSEELAAIGLAPIKAKNLLLRENGPNAIEEGYFAINRELIENFWNSMVDMGRQPKESEYPRIAELKSIGLSPAAARELFIEKFGAETLTAAYDIRRNDLLVFLALANFKHPANYSDLDARLQNDIKTFFGGYRQALEESRQLLFSVGNADRVEELCNQFPDGYRDEQALYIHKSLINQLPPELRVFIGCAQILYGDLEGVDIIKLHKRSGKVTLLIYDDFERKRLPILKERIKIKLREQDTDFFVYDGVMAHQVLYNKDLFVPATHPKKRTWSEFSQRLERVIGPIVGYGPTLEELGLALKEKGYTVGLRRLEASK